MRVLMLGWEFPPFISGGLGTACHGLTRAMTRLKTEILFVLPKAVTAESSSHTPVTGPTPRRAAAGAGTMTFRTVPSHVTSPYPSASRPVVESAHRPAEPGVRSAALGGDALLRVVGAGAAGGYEGDLIGRIEEYAQRCLELTCDEEFDVVHAHDWVTYPAGVAIAARSGKPLVVHVHSTEFDRSGEQICQAVYDVERRGMHAAQAVIAVSHLTARIVIERYDVPPEKVHVVHNGIEPKPAAAPPHRNGGEKTVLFLGRITMQKGPEFFISAAVRVLSKIPDARFIIGGWGDLGPRMTEQVAAMGLSSRIRFAGFLRGKDVERAYRAADVYVMPSVSEPFGLTALEAIQNGVPVVLSKNSGVAEVLARGALKVDFWDVEQMADKIVALLRYPPLGEALCRNAADEIRPLTWDEAARKCVGIYAEQVETLKS